MRIMIVDDHPIVRDGLAGIVAREPDLEIVAEASNGDEALALVERARPDVILMDLRMPGRDGVATIRTLHERGSTARILVLTTYDTDRDILAAIDAGHRGMCSRTFPATSCSGPCATWPPDVPCCRRGRCRRSLPATPTPS